MIGIHSSFISTAPAAVAGWRADSFDLSNPDLRVAFHRPQRPVGAIEATGRPDSPVLIHTYVVNDRSSLELSVNRITCDGDVAAEIGTGLVIESVGQFPELLASGLQEIPGRGILDHGLYMFILSQVEDQQRLQQTTILTHGELWFRYETVTTTSTIDLRGTVEAFAPCHQSFSVGRPVPR